MSLSEAEWVLIRDGAEAGLRTDGRGPEVISCLQSLMVPQLRMT